MKKIKKQHTFSFDEKLGLKKYLVFLKAEKKIANEIDDYDYYDDAKCYKISEASNGKLTPEDCMEIVDNSGRLFHIKYKADYERDGDVYDGNPWDEDNM